MKNPLLMNFDAGMPLDTDERAELIALAEDGLRFRAGVSAMLGEDEAFMDACETAAAALGGDEKPTLEQIRAVIDAGLAAQEGN